MRRLVMLVSIVLVAGCGGERFELAGGEATALADWQDRVVVINYWAEWCAPCREEIPEFNELHAESGDSGPLVFGVNYDRLVGEDLSGVITRMEIGFPTLVADPSERFGYPVPAVMPTTYILSGDQNVHAVLRGPQSLADLHEAVQAASAPEATGTDTP